MFVEAFEDNTRIPKEKEVDILLSKDGSTATGIEEDDMQAITYVGTIN